ncbi:MAG: peptide transporter [Deltaproteobacteria bacterium]|nr:peptide transporter [Deltaproteobacteria bacterium]
MTDASPDSRAGLSARAIAKNVTSNYRELTAAAMILGIIQGVVLNLSFVYASLKLGFSIGGSTVAAIMGYALLRGVMKKGTTIENNINQTIASGINTAGTGVVFTFPALFLLNAQAVAEGREPLVFDALPFLIAGVGGAILGVVVIVPLRKQMIDLDRLRFPTGVATAAILKSGKAGIGKAKLLAAGFAISAAVKLVMASGVLNGIWIGTKAEPLLALHGGDMLDFNMGIIPLYLAPAISVSLMNVAAGMLAGRGGLAFFVGGAIAWWIISPIAVNLGWVSANPADGLESILYGSMYSNMLRPLGIGILIGGAIMGVIMTFPAIKSAFVSLANAAKTSNSGDGTATSDELPLQVLVAGVAVGMLLFFAAAKLTPGVSVGQAILAAVIGTVWLALAALIVAQATGMTDISPMSGMALISVTLMMFLLDKNVLASMVVGVAVCVAIGQGADMMQDLKTGFMIGGKPVKQGIAQFAATWMGPIITMGALYFFWSTGPNGTGGFGPGTPLPAPQAGALMGIVEGLSTGNIPVDKYAFGATLGVVLGTAPVAGLGVLIGLAMYLPFYITLGYGVGCFLQMGLEKWKGPGFYQARLVPFAAGLIVGEALTGMGYTAFQIAFGGGGGGH